jgi:hypothetical protein
VDHVVIFDPALVTARDGRPNVPVALEARDRPGPAYKQGVFSDDMVWIRMGPLLVAKARVKIAWKGEYAFLREIRDRTKGSPLHDAESFWAGKPKIGYAIVAQLKDIFFLKEPALAGPRSYGYEWIVIENEKKQDTWLTRRPPEDKDAALVRRFNELSRA